MGYELTHADGSTFVFPGEEWWYVLELMRQYGWEAAGTTGPSPEGSWDGSSPTSWRGASRRGWGT